MIPLKQLGLLFSCVKMGDLVKKQAEIKELRKIVRKPNGVSTIWRMGVNGEISCETAAYILSSHNRFKNMLVSIVDTLFA